MPAALNKNNSAVKRIMQEARELSNDPSTDYHAAPLEDDIFVSGRPHQVRTRLNGSFRNGIAHYEEYPFRPPSIMMLTPSGRFELNTKICISFTNYHEELWQPAWGVRTAIVGLQGFFPLKGQVAAGVGSVESPGSERRRLAALSRDWECPHCKVPNKELLPDPTPDSAKPTSGGPVSEQPPALESPKDTSEACSAGIPVTPKASEPQGGSNEKASLDDREPHRSSIPSPPVSARPGGSTTSASPTAATEYPNGWFKVSLLYIDGDSSSGSSSQRPPMPPSSSSSSAIKPRRNSLRLSTQPHSVPVPPSLLQSPYLTAPKRPPPSQAPSHVPSEEDDSWLQDQVPLSASGSRSSFLPAHTKSQLHQSPPLTPPVRPTTVIVGTNNSGLLHIGDWRVTSQPPPQSLEHAGYPFPSPSATHAWRKSSSSYGAALKPPRSDPKASASSPGYFSDFGSMQ
ncbi:hypothetical protein MD484_g2810, partial [Candolleomyces efflorescens]